MSDIKQSILNKNRKDKFLLVLNLPNVLKKINNAGERTTKYVNQDSLQYSVYGSVVPPIAIPAIELDYAGQTVNVTGYHRPVYPPITVNFTIDNGFNNYWVLWKWLDLINDSYMSSYNAKNLKDPEARFTDSYTTQITLYGLDEFNQKTIQFDYTHAFITGLGDINYNYRDGEQIESSFTFAFGQLKSELL